MKLYAISGLGADKRVFNYLTINCELIPIDWIEPKAGEGIEEYSLRMAEAISKDEEFIILGLSFGGLVATEISKKLNPKLTILISSAETRLDLRWIYKTSSKTKIINALPEKLFDIPKFLAYYIFGTENKKLLNEILDDTDYGFVKWAVKELINWQNEERLENCLKIHGTKDKLLPAQIDEKVRLIDEGQHLMIIDRAKEISEIINKELN